MKPIPLWQIPPEGIKCIGIPMSKRDEDQALRELVVNIIPWGSHHFLSDCGGPCGMPITAHALHRDLNVKMDVKVDEHNA